MLHYKIVECFSELKACTDHRFFTKMGHKISKVMPYPDRVRNFTRCPDWGHE
jgi:hypothetical protein